MSFAKSNNLLTRQAISSTLFFTCKRRVVDPPKGGLDLVSQPGKRHWHQCMAPNLLTPNALRCSTLSSASRKEGVETSRPIYPPECATLFDPLFGKPKRGCRNIKTNLPPRMRYAVRHPLRQ